MSREKGKKFAWNRNISLPCFFRLFPASGTFLRFPAYRENKKTTTQEKNSGHRTPERNFFRKIRKTP